jgi:hypothetical protein
MDMVPALDEARARGTHDEYHLADVKKVAEEFPNRRFDACVALDVIEHLEKEDGWRMLESMQKLAARRVVIFTPNGFIPQKSKDGDLQEHLSGWTADEMRARGYQVFGMYGPKWMRGEYHMVKYQAPAPLGFNFTFVPLPAHANSPGKGGSDLLREGCDEVRSGQSYGKTSST